MTEIKSAALELGTERIRKLLVQYAVPAIIAMTASSLYNMVDSIFIGHGVGPLAISGLALTFPLMNLAAAFGSLVGVGAATLISMRLGQRDYETAQRVLGNVLVLNLIIGIAFGLVALLFLDSILYFFGASEATIGYAREYMTVILLGNVVTHMYLGLNSVLRASGHPRKSMYATINTVVINTILDPLFIFGFGWGIRGAAIATVLAQVISLVWQLRILSNKQELLHFRRGIYRLRKKIVRDMLAIGMSPFLMNLAACFIVILINKGLKEYGGDLMIGAYGIVNRLAFFFVMIVLGVNQGMQPIAGYNFGAKQYDRVMRVLKLTMIGATCVTTAGFLLGEFMPRLAVGMFHLRRGADPPGGRRHAHRLLLLPDHRFPDGGHQLLYEHRHGRQGDLPVAVAPAAVSDARTDLPAAHFRRLHRVERQLGRVVLDAAVGLPGFAGGFLHADLPTAEIPGHRCGKRRQRGIGLWNNSSSTSAASWAAAAGPSGRSSPAGWA